MFNVVFKLYLLRLFTIVFIVLILPLCSGLEPPHHASAVICIATVLCLWALDNLSSHTYTKPTYKQTFIRLIVWINTLNFLSATNSFFSLYQVTFLRGMNDTSLLPVENAEVLTYVNLNSVYNCLLDEVTCFIKLLLSMIRYVYRRCGTLKPLLYIGYLCINSLLLFHIVCLVISHVQLNLQQGIFRESNFIYDSTSEDLDLLRQPILDNTSKIYEKIDGILPNEGGVYREDYVRYIGEDVQIDCSFHSLHLLGVEKYNFYWMKNGKVLNNTSDRIQQNVNFFRSSNILWIKMNLTIRFLQEDDFGLYKCIRETRRIYFEQILLDIFLPVEYTTRRYIGKSFVFRAADVLEKLEIPVGHFIYRKQLLYITLDDTDGISFEYKVNGKDVHSICLPDAMSCSLSVLLYTSWIFGGSFHTKFTPYKRILGQIGASYIKSHMCACGRFYGEHTLTMYIPYFNSTSRREEIVEITHEKKITVQPVAWWRNNSMLYENLLFDPVLESSRDIKWYITELICSSQEFDLLIINIISWVVIMLILVMLFRFFSRPFNMYCKLCVIPVQNFIFYGHCFPKQKQKQTVTDTVAEIESVHEIQYDVFLSHSMEDYGWAKNVILPFLEKDCGYQVCFPERDFVDYGKSKLALYSKATEESMKYLVVLSTNYIKDPDCNRLQLSTCILPLINSENGKGRDIVFLKLSPGISIPVQLKWNIDVRIIDWTNCGSDDEKKMQLKRVLQLK